MQDIFLEYKTFIVFLHVISAVVWVGGMIAMRYAAHYSFLEIGGHINFAQIGLYYFVLTHTGICLTGRKAALHY